GGVAKLGVGTLVVSGTNTYEGGTTIAGGALQIAANANLGAAAGGLTFNGGVLYTTADLTMARPTTLAGSGKFLTVPGTTLTHNGTITGSGQLTKDGGGTLVLAGDNDYAGGTLVLAGDLVVDSDSLPGDAAVWDGAFVIF